MQSFISFASLLIRRQMGMLENNAQFSHKFSSACLICIAHKTEHLRYSRIIVNDRFVITSIKSIDRLDKSTFYFLGIIVQSFLATRPTWRLVGLEKP